IHGRRLKMSVNFEEKIKKYRTAPFDARFPNTNQTRNCYQNYLDYHRCNKVLSAKNQKTTPCEWYRRVYKSLCPIAWVLRSALYSAASHDKMSHKQASCISSSAKVNFWKRHGGHRRESVCV
ncbi:hypothetical protein CCH79_00014161, partial [Gambusia affinis]